MNMRTYVSELNEAEAHLYVSSHFRALWKRMSSKRNPQQITQLSTLVDVVTFEAYLHSILRKAQSSLYKDKD
eukprot:1560487-Amphidinium_carterae.1